MRRQTRTNALFAAQLLVTVFLASYGRAADTSLVRSSDPLPPEEEQAKLKVPDGFQIQLFASEPMINKPINLAHDDRGRVWVSSTVEYPYAAKKDRWEDEQGSRVRDSSDAIKILEDTDGDGRADKVTDFVDGLNIPTGVVPWHKPEHKDGCIAWSIPNIWYFADIDGDGKCDHREVIFGPLGYERDTHGMCSSFRLRDGWVYATHGFNNTSKLVAKDGSELEMHSGNVFRFRPDGSRVEIWSRGQVNPFGLCFDRRGNLYSADCHSAPVYQLLRGAYYPSFGKPHDGLGFGPTMIRHTHGSTGICGIVYIDRGIWGKEWDDRILIGNPVTSRVNQDIVEFVGSTPTAVEQPDFIVSDDSWFRPVDLCLGSDGALYVADFYNKIIGHYEVPLDHPGRDRTRGRIWKITPKKGPSKPEPIAKREAEIEPAHLSSPSPFTRRDAAAHFQQHPDLDALGPLVSALSEVAEGDTHLHHGLRLAVREHLKLPGAGDVLNGLAENQRSRILDISLAVHSPDSAEYLAEVLESDSGLSRDLKLKALEHIGRNASTGVLRSTITREASIRSGDPVADTGRLSALIRGLEVGGSTTPEPELITWGQTLAREILGNSETPQDNWVTAPHAANPKSKSPWVIEPRKCNDGSEEQVISSLVKAGKDAEERVGILRSKSFNAPEKFGFWICGHRGPPGNDAHEKNYVRMVAADSGEEIARSFPPRSDVCTPVSWDLSSHTGKQVQLEIVDGDQGASYAWLGVTRLDAVAPQVTDFKGSDARSGALHTLASLLKITAPADLRDQLRPWLPPAPAPAPVAISKEERARLDELIKKHVTDFTANPGDPGKGLATFKIHCAACHQVGGEGGLVGPQLDGIGARGVERLCEDILDPNRNVDTHFLLTSIVMKDGTAAAGMVRGEQGALIILTDIAGQEHRLQKDAIKTRDTLPVSLMPAGFAERMSIEEFRHLLSWLLTQK